MASRAEWAARGRDAILELLAKHLVASAHELEARISDQPWDGQPQPINPHLLTQARKDLERTGQIECLDDATRGGGKVKLWRPEPIPRGKSRAITDAAGRKRLLVARWRSWGKASPSMPNLIGKGGEAVLHASLLAAAASGYRVIQPGRGEVTAIYGKPVAGGSLDNGAWLTRLDPQTQSPTGTYLVPIEAKNVRSWLYPTAHEPFQLLEKAARLANDHPEHPVLPILVCRKAHDRLRWLAADLGFQIFATHDQYVHPSERINATHFDEVRDELGFADLRISADANPALTTWFQTTIVSAAPTFSDRWMAVGRHHPEIYKQLRLPNLDWNERVELLEQLHDEVEASCGGTRGWAPAASASEDVPF